MLFTFLLWVLCGPLGLAVKLKNVRDKNLVLRLQSENSGIATGRKFAKEVNMCRFFELARTIQQMVAQVNVRSGKVTGFGYSLYS
jgi:hypothetical protein